MRFHRWLILSIMLRFGKGFLTPFCDFRCCRPLFSLDVSDGLDGLLDDVLSRGVSVSSTLTDGDNPAAGWRQIDWEAEERTDTEPPTPPSPVDVITVRDRLLYVKRDDQLRLPGSQIAGNKVSEKMGA